MFEVNQTDRQCSPSLGNLLLVSTLSTLFEQRVYVDITCFQKNIKIFSNRIFGQKEVKETNLKNVCLCKLRLNHLKVIVKKRSYAVIYHHLT